MKIILLTNHAAILPAVEHFHSKKWLKAVISPGKSYSEKPQIAFLCEELDVPFYKVQHEDLTTTLHSLFNQIEPDLALIYGFSYKLPSQVFSIPSIGCFNIHFSLLPAYAGPDPIFWQIRNGEQMGGITIHRVDENFDSGEIVMQQQMPFIPGESWGICNSRYSTVVLNMLVSLIANLQADHQLKAQQSRLSKASYFPRPVIEDLLINWDIATTEQIENLVNACNPNAGGAITYLNHQAVRILEVSPVDGKGEPGTAPGTIIHADLSGLYVQCLDGNLMRINILKINEGFITGFKLVALGVKKGDCFKSGHYRHQVPCN